MDSPLEGSGFEPSVPRKAPVVVLVSVLVRADFSVSGESSGGAMSPSRNLACVTRYRRFESGFLQRGVRCEPDDELPSRGRSPPKPVRGPRSGGIGEQVTQS